VAAKKNCWEAKKCGREPGGAKAGEMGICPVTVETKLDGVHGDRCAGRACWVVAGSLCGGTVQGTFAAKFEDCENCEFYAAVREEELPSFQYSSTLLAKLRR
jgi:hypothetical protein